MTESPEEKEALELDEEARDVGWAEFDKEAEREFDAGWDDFSTAGWSFRGLLAWFGRPRRLRRVGGDPERERKA